MNQFTLEKSRYFPYVAWTLIIAFAVFVGSLTLELRHAINEISAVSQSTTVVSPNSNIPL